MRILALDQSGYCGFCHGDVEVADDIAGAGINRPIYGTQRLPSRSPLSHRLVYFEDWLRDMIKANGIVRVYFEEPIATAVSSFQSRVATYGYAAAIGMACRRELIDCFPIAMQSWRSEFGVPTAAPKKMRDKEARRKWVKAQTLARCQQLGLDPQDDNASDAIGIWWAAAHRMLRKSKQATFDFDGLTV